MAVIVDTGVLLATAESDVSKRFSCSELLRTHRGKLWVPAPVIPETSWQIERNLGPASETAFLRLITGEHLRVIDLTLTDWLWSLAVAASVLFLEEARKLLLALFAARPVVP